ncbi:hypothetical protein ACTFQF_17650 [Aliivibrio fischeri]|uniref:hypothetical protein n=1 Tax=Aliivibrio fischeri TaxID=668 RepID=UPI0007C4436A|nr:hypothetical protein [Aliivibrio fischeri]MBP3139229.1 hypothetical protein [Aliivibrio fischeri]MBP3154819.1 hypothetical protein [Aliivibrio fischeri]MCE7574523.1 hypothetical protein [Aliivibrio fischeri]
MRYVNLIILFFLSFNAIANDKNAEFLFKALNDKSDYCLQSTYRQVNEFKDKYYDSLSELQKKALLLTLSKRALAQCSSYEMSEYLKYIIVNNDTDRIKFISDLYKNDFKHKSYEKLYQSLDKQEIDRLSKTEMFSTPFDTLSVID